MASTTLRTKKDGTRFYEITVSRGRQKSPLTTRWEVPSGWSQRAIDRELAKVSAEFERKVKAGEVISREEQRELDRQRKLEEAQIKTFRQYAESVFMPSITARCSENTRCSYQGNLDNWIYPALGDIRLPDISAAEIEALFVSMQTKKKAHSTIVKVYTILKGIFKKARKSGIIQSNPMEYVDRPAPRKDEVKTETEAYTVNEIRYILECLEQEPLQWRTMIELLIDTGIRRGECCGLRWKDIDFKAHTITVCGSLSYTPQEGVYLDTTKNKRQRTIDVSPEIISLLKQLRIDQATRAISQYVFTQGKDPSPIHPQSPTRYLTKFQKRYGIEHLHPHKLRHSFASVAITHGADIASVSEKLGHSDKAVTLRMYTHADPESIKRASNIFRNAIKAADEQVKNA